MLKLILHLLLFVSAVWSVHYTVNSDNEIRSNDIKETENWAYDYEHNEVDTNIIPNFDKNYEKVADDRSENYEEQAEPNSKRNSTETSTIHLEFLGFSITESPDKQFKIASDSQNENLSTENDIKVTNEDFIVVPTEDNLNEDLETENDIKVTNEDFEDFIIVPTEDNQNENFKQFKDSVYTTIIPDVYINKKSTEEDIKVTTENLDYFSILNENYVEIVDSEETSTEENIKTTTEDTQYYSTGDEIFDDTTTEISEKNIDDVLRDIKNRYESGVNILEIFNHIDNNYPPLLQMKSYSTLYKLITEDDSNDINNWNLKFAQFLSNFTSEKDEYLKLYKAIPRCVLRVFLSDKVFIQSQVYKEMLVASEIMEDELKRDVFFTNLTENSDNANCVWHTGISESKRGVSLVLENKFYNETLFASSFISGNMDHIVYTSAAGQFKAKSRWILEPVDEAGEVCLLKNAFWNEYLCAYDERFYHWTHYRRLFTKRRGSSTDESCHFSYQSANGL